MSIFFIDFIEIQIYYFYADEVLEAVGRLSERNSKIALNVVTLTKINSKQMESIAEAQNEQISAMKQVIRKLRTDNLNQGYCFMIFDDDLPEYQAYYEYPDGDINIEQINKDNPDMDREIIKVLTKDEVAAVKEKHEVLN
jgi:hypothetical protein